MNNITTLENVFQRIDVMFQTCHDSLIPVADITPELFALIVLRVN